MKTKPETKEKERDFDTVKTFRIIKEKISKDIAEMDAKQITKLLKRQKSSSTRLTACVQHLA